MVPFPHLTDCLPLFPMHIDASLSCYPRNGNPNADAHACPSHTIPSVIRSPPPPSLPGLFGNRLGFPARYAYAHDVVSCVATHASLARPGHPPSTASLQPTTGHPLLSSPHLRRRLAQTVFLCIALLRHSFLSYVLCTLLRVYGCHCPWSMESPMGPIYD